MTEKNYNPEQKKSKAMQKQKKSAKIIANAPIKDKTENKKIENTEEPKKQESSEQEKKEEIKPEIKETKKKPEKIKRDEAKVDVKSVPISTLHAIAICKFIIKKKIEKAISDLEDVLKHRKAIPMKGEVPHKKGDIMSGKYPKKAVEYFIKIVKNLKANSNYNGIENPIIIKAMANKASQPYGRFGRVRRKRTHIQLIAREFGGKK
jgi:large subunit ribosomal protein L22